MVSNLQKAVDTALLVEHMDPLRALFNDCSTLKQFGERCVALIYSSFETNMVIASQNENFGMHQT